VAFRSTMMRDNDPYGLSSWEQYDLIDEHLVVSPARSSLECVIYFDPHRRESLDFDRIEERVAADLAPRHRVFRFEPLTGENMASWSPFLTAEAERAFLRHGYGRAPVGLSSGIPRPPRPVGSPEKNRTLNLNYDAFYGLAAKLNASLRAIQDIRPAGALPAWLRRDPAEILQPVCGCLPRNGEDKLGIPLTRQGDLWLGCDDFKRSQIVFPAVAATPATAVTKGREVRVRWYGLSQEKMRAQIRRELTDCLDNGVDGFDLPALALFMCQNVMMLRLAAEAVRRRFAASRDQYDDDRRVRDHEDLNLSLKIEGAHDIDPGRVRLQIEHWEPTLAERTLIGFYGGTAPVPSHNSTSEALRIERLARWVGELRRGCHADLDPATAADILSIFERPSPEFQDLFDHPPAWSAFAVLDSMIGGAGWNVLREASLRVVERSVPFSVSYALSGQGQRLPGASVDLTNRHVAVFGPALLLPIENGSALRDQARVISPRGLYVD
jgi:hypothetical protein